MKRLSFAGAMVFIVTLTVIVCSSRNVAAQAAKPATSKAAATPATTTLTSQQSAALKLGWDNILRGYEDLKSTPPDVKGDTSRLEGHMSEAMNLLHQADPAHIPAAPSNIPVEDKGHTRAFILSAVKGHLDKATNVIKGAKVNNPNITQALQNIAVAEQELSAAGAAAAVK
jgi:hypothetical protein